MSGFMIRVRKEEVLKELPPVRYDIVPLQVTPIPLPAVPQGLSDADFLKYLSGATGDEHVMRLRRHLGIAKSIPAIEYIDDFLNNLSPMKKVLVFAHHTEVIERLYDNLQNWHPVQITGASSTGERSKAINTFLTDRKCRLFIGNIQASGMGLTLVGPSCWCSDVIFVEASYSVGDNVQAAARVHRIGQHEAVVARFLTAHRTIDDRIQSILTRKANDFASLFN
jgi:SWI/SNF-related matrix-associated actin-dependent regulator 1 of chromatin subfamily A